MKHNQKKILIVLSGYFPAQTYGGPPVSIHNFCNLLHDSFSFFIVTSNHELKRNESLEGIENGWNQRENCKVLYLDHGEWTIRKFKVIVDEIEPSLIYINSLFSYDTTITFLSIAKSKKISVLLAPRGELCANAFKKKYKKIPYLIYHKSLLKNNNVWYQSTSDEETIQLERLLGINKERIFQLENIPSNNQNGHTLLRKEKNDIKIVYISRIVPKKNLLYALKVLKLINKDIRVSFDIYGNIEDETYWTECLNEIDNMPKNVDVSYKGLLKHEEVAECFSKYHCFLFPTQSENYGHVIAEAILSDCIVLTSDQVPWRDLDDYGVGRTISLEKINNFVSAIELLAGFDQKEYLHIVTNLKQYAEKKFDNSSVKQKYLNALKNILGE